MSQITQQKFQELYQEYGKRLYGASEKIVKDHQRAEDVIQDVFLRLHKQDFSKIEGHLHEWLFTVCRNCSIKTYHKRNRYVLVENIEELDCVDESASTSEDMIQSELLKSMMKLVVKLSKNQQKALKLRYFQDHTYASIAKKMKTTTGNVGFMLNNAVKRLKILLDKENKKKGLY
jgi:RNA polymerase sigma-70 factor (ECF subfamily)